MLYTLTLTVKTGNNITSSESIKVKARKISEPNSCMICLMLQYLPNFIRYPRISISFSSTCLMHDISITYTSVSIVRTKIHLYLLLIKFNVCLTRRWSTSSVHLDEPKPEFPTLSKRMEKL